WDKMMHAAWDSAEPGIIYWDTVLNTSMADEFADKGYKTVCTNPCVTGDTKVAVAEGRGFVSFKTLADEGRDVRVYSRNEETGKLEIKTMRNPHRTKENAEIYEVTIEGGHIFKATGNHKVPVLYSGEKRVDELVSGDKLFVKDVSLERSKLTGFDMQSEFMQMFGEGQSDFSLAKNQGYEAKIVNNLVDNKVASRTINVKLTCESCKTEY